MMRANYKGGEFRRQELSSSVIYSLWGPFATRQYSVMVDSSKLQFFSSCSLLLKTFPGDRSASVASSAGAQSSTGGGIRERRGPQPQPAPGLEPPRPIPVKRDSRQRAMPLKHLLQLFRLRRNCTYQRTLPLKHLLQLFHLRRNASNMHIQTRTCKETH